GRLVADPEFSMTQSNMAICHIRIAVDRSYTKAGEERQSDFFRITCFGKTAEHVNRYFVKGKPILVEGRIQNNNYTDNNGVQHYQDQIIADNVSFLLTDPTRTQNGNNAGNYNNYNNYNNQQNYNNNGYNNNNYNQQNRNPQPAPQQTPPPPQQNNAPTGGSDDFNEFQEIISDGALPF
ncbi:MAG: single-stranded DNA-binding protein, partial [Oscillospiraceae bacterium]|nr:single-stranded DNA-binding protein [Oscillospiraceae bacterium]